MGSAPPNPSTDPAQKRYPAGYGGYKYSGGDQGKDKYGRSYGDPNYENPDNPGFFEKGGALDFSNPYSLGSAGGVNNPSTSAAASGATSTQVDTSNPAGSSTYQWVDANGNVVPQGTPGARPAQTTQFTDPSLNKTIPNLEGQLATNLSTPIDFGSLGKLDTGVGAGKKAYEEIYGEGKAHLDPQYADAEKQELQRLADEGLSPTDAAYKATQNQFDMGKGDAYAALASTATQGQTAVQAETFKENLDSRKQAIGEMLSQRNMPVEDISKVMTTLASIPSIGTPQGIQSLTALGMGVQEATDLIGSIGGAATGVAKAAAA